MSEALTSETLNSSLSPEIIENERAQFTLDLVNAGLISTEFAESGTLDRFNLDETTGVDSLKHVLIGDVTGGLHHANTVLGLGIDTRVIASEIADPNRPDRKPKAFRDEQRVINSNGVYGANNISIIEDDITYSKIGTVEKNGESLDISIGSTMFPDQWSTEDVLKAITGVADTPSVRESGKASKPRLVHDATINGVRIKVITDKATGKIITASPNHSGRYFR